MGVRSSRRMKMSKESLWSTRPTNTFYSRIFKRNKARDISCLMKNYPFIPMPLSFSPVASYYSSKCPIWFLPLADFFVLFILGPSSNQERRDLRFEAWKPDFLSKEIWESTWLISGERSVNWFLSWKYGAWHNGVPLRIWILYLPFSSQRAPRSDSFTLKSQYY